MSNESNFDPRLLEGKVVTPEGYVYDPAVMQEEYASDVIDPSIPTHDIEIPIKRGVAGFVNAKVMGPPKGLSKQDHLKMIEEGESDAYEVVNETGWKKNKILSCGLDKIANMPWAQVFQFCMAGTSKDTTPVDFYERSLKEVHSINSFWLVEEPHCGTWIGGAAMGSVGNIVKLRRTFDFYKVHCPTVITEIGFKESPAARELFSRILLDPPQQLHAGQFLRIEYQLNVVMKPWSQTLTAATFGNVISNGEIHDYSQTAHKGNLFTYGTPVTAEGSRPTIIGWNTSDDDIHGLQLVGMCGIDPMDGLAKPIDKSGLCNEPFAPGTCSFGPGYGYVNRWRNGGAVNYVKSGLGGGTLQTSQLYTSGGNPYTEIGPLYDYVDTDAQGLPDVTTLAKVYRNPHEWLNYTLASSNDNRTDKDGLSAKGALYVRTDAENDYVRANHDVTITRGNASLDYRTYIYMNYWQAGIFENMGHHHGYQSGSPTTTWSSSNSNAYGKVYIWDRDFQIRYWKEPKRGTSGTASPETMTHDETNAAITNINDPGPYYRMRKDGVGEGQDPSNWSKQSVYKHTYGMTGKSSAENLDHLWDSVVKFDIGRGSWSNEVFVHVTNRNWSSTATTYAAWASNCYPVAGTGDPCTGKTSVNPWAFYVENDRARSLIDPGVSFWHAHHLAFWDPALGVPAINAMQCGSARVFLSGFWHTYCPSTDIVHSPGELATLGATWSDAHYGGLGRNAYAYETKSGVPFVLGLSGELIPTMEPNPNMKGTNNDAGVWNNGKVAGAGNPGGDPGLPAKGWHNFSYWPDWNRDVPYKDDFVAGSSCFLSTASAPPTASFGYATRWSGPSAAQWDGWSNTGGETISASNWVHQKFEGANPEYNAFVSEVSSTTLNRWDGTAGSHNSVANDANRGPYHDGIQLDEGILPISAVELPLRLEPYQKGSHRRVKYAVFDPAIGNGRWYSVGVGPTSKSIINNQWDKMWEAATYPGYVYTFSGERDTTNWSITGNEKLSTHQLKLSFIYQWSALTSYGN